MEDLINYMKKRLFEKLSEMIDKCITQNSELYPKVMIYSYSNFGYSKDELIENRPHHLSMNTNRFIEPTHFKERFDAIFDELLASNCIFINCTQEVKTDSSTYSINNYKNNNTIEKTETPSGGGGNDSSDTFFIIFGAALGSVIIVAAVVGVIALILLKRTKASVDEKKQVEIHV